MKAVIRINGNARLEAIREQIDRVNQEIQTLRDMERELPPFSIEFVNSEEKASTDATVDAK